MAEKKYIKSKTKLSNKRPDVEFVMRELVSPDSKVLHEINVETNRIERTFEYKPEPTNTQREVMDMSKGYCWCHKWCMVMGVLFLIASLFVFIVSITVVSIAPRPALYGQDCNHRSCLKSLNAKCINGTCQCQANQYFEISCLNKRYYTEQCHADYVCYDKTNMTCLNGVCTCTIYQYWDGEKCSARRNYSQPCRGQQCLTNLMLYCSPNYLTCICPNDRYVCKTFIKFCLNVVFFLKILGWFSLCTQKNLYRTMFKCHCM